MERIGEMLPTGFSPIREDGRPTIDRLCAFSSRGNVSSRPTIPPRAGPSGELSPQLTAFFTSAPIFASSAAVNSFSAKATGHRASSSRFAASLKPNVAYLVLNFCALWKKQTTLPSLAYAGIPYQSLGERAGALALMIAWRRLPMARSGSGISAIFDSTALSPSALSARGPRRAPAFSSWARSFIATRSSSVNPLDVLPIAVLLLADSCVAFVVVLLVDFCVALFALIVPSRAGSRCPPQPSHRSGQLVGADQVARGIAEGAVANAVRLLGRLLGALGVAGLHPLESAVEVGGGQGDDGVGSLGHHLGDGAALVLGDAGACGRRVQDDGRAGLGGGADRDPADPAVFDVFAG